MKIKYKLILLIVPFVIFPVLLILLIFTNITSNIIVDFEVDLIDSKLYSFKDEIKLEKSTLNRLNLMDSEFYLKNAKNELVKYSSKHSSPGRTLLIYEGDIFLNPNGLNFIGLSSSGDDSSFRGFISKVEPFNENDSLEYYEQKNYLFNFFYDPEWDWYVFFITDKNEIFKPLFNLFWISLFITFISLGISISFIFLVAKNFSIPIESLKENSLKLSKGNFDIDLEIKTDDELEDLGIFFRKMAKNLENLINARTNFLNQVAHDLRTPLTPIKILVEDILKYHNPKGIIKKNLIVINRNIKSLSYLVTDVLKVVNLDSGKHKFDFECVNLSEYLKGIVDDNAPSTRIKGIKLSFSCAKKMPLIWLDKNKISEVFGNLISNSIKFRNPKKVSSKTAFIKLTAKNLSDFILFKVVDNGLGIDKKKLKDIFIEFNTGDVSRHDAAASSGLGLSICRRIIDAHKGTIWAESKGVNKGAEICFKLPLMGKHCRK